VIGRNPDRRAAKTAPKHAAEGKSAKRSHAPRHARASRSMGRGAARMLAPVILVLLTIGALVLGAFPTRTWLEQRRTVSAAEHHLSELQAANDEAQAQADALRTDAEIERIAREQYGYAKAGEEVYHLLPPAQDPVRVPDAWPFTGLGSTLER
jgi:cell division protein FtsB